MKNLAIIGLILAMGAPAALADALVATRTIRSNTVLTASDITVNEALIGPFTHPAELIGLETRVVLYAGRPIHIGDVGAPAIVERNQIVPLIFQTGGLRIVTEGRALGRGGVGDGLRIMNLASRKTVTGIVAADGSVHVQR